MIVWPQSHHIHIAQMLRCEKTLYFSLTITVHTKICIMSCRDCSTEKRSLLEMCIKSYNRDFDGAHFYIL